jgi:hypothetical protein
MAVAGTPLEERHESTRHLMRTLTPNPRLDGIVADVAALTWHLAGDLLAILADGPELSAGLRKLREAKDCLVIQALADSGAIGGLYAVMALIVTSRGLPHAERITTW